MINSDGSDNENTLVVFLCMNKNDVLLMLEVNT